MSVADSAASASTDSTIHDASTGHRISDSTVPYATTPVPDIAYRTCEISVSNASLLEAPNACSEPDIAYWTRGSIRGSYPWPFAASVSLFS
eukprot:1490020-Rhodomonas_salina.1